MTKKEQELVFLGLPMADITAQLTTRITNGLSDANRTVLDAFTATQYSGEDTTTGTLTGVVEVSGLIDYFSSIDSITNLKLKYAYDIGMTNLPIVAIVHGFNQQISDFDMAVFTRMAGYKFFLVAVGMRGRDGASGSKDASGRETQDVVDAVEYVKTNFLGRVDPEKKAAVGYSGGGGTVLALQAKHPDYFNVYVAHFPISDYGQDPTFGWWQQMTAAGNSAQVANIDAQVGGNPATFPDRYVARNHVLAAARNCKRGFLYLFHDADDVSVPSNQSSRVATNYVSEGNPNYRLSITTSADATRWLHDLPNGTAAVIQSEPFWKGRILTRNPWIIPAAGTLLVAGYVKTKRFTIMLGTGIDEAANVTYNTATDSYTVTPLTGTMTVSITQGAKVITQSISSTTTLVPNDSVFNPIQLSPADYLQTTQNFTGSGASWLNRGNLSWVFNLSSWNLFVKLAPTDGQPELGTQVYFGYFVSGAADTVSFRLDSTGKLSCRLGAITTSSNANILTTVDVIFPNGATTAKVIEWRNVKGVVECWVDGVQKALTSTSPNAFGPYSTRSLYYGATNNYQNASASNHYAGVAKGLFLKGGQLTTEQRGNMLTFLTAL